MIHDEYTVKTGDTLTSIARVYKFNNPGVIVAYPENRARFNGKSPNSIRPNEKLKIPWHPDALKGLIKKSEELISIVASDAQKMIDEQVHDAKQLEKFLSNIDLLNFLAGVTTGIASLASAGARGATMTQKEALVWLADYGASRISSITTMTVAAPTAPKRALSFVVRHTLGPWNPSYWASVAVAIKEGDVDTYLYGSAATTYKVSKRIKEHADADISRLQKRIASIRAQLGMPFYQHRI